MGHRRVKEDDPDMKGQRSRNETDGRMRQKRGDTLAGTLEKEYDVDFPVRTDARLDTLRKRTGKNGVSDVIDALTD